MSEENVTNQRLEGVFAEGKPVTVSDIIVAQDVEYARIPGFKSGTVFVIQSLTAGDLIEWSEANEGEAKRTAGLRLIVKSLVDGEPGIDDGATGKTILTDKHIGLLRSKSHKVTENIVKSILKLNGMTVKGEKDAKND